MSSEAFLPDLADASKRNVRHQSATLITSARASKVRVEERDLGTSETMMHKSMETQENYPE